MASLSGAIGGAGTGASIGSAFGPWGTGIGAAIGGLAGLFGGGGGMSSEQKQYLQQMSQTLKLMQDRAKFYDPFAQRFLQNANLATGQAMNFWNPILSGDRTAISSVFAPDINRVNEQYQGILDATQGSRTGAGASLYAAAPYQKQQQIQSIFQGARPQAAQAVGQLGQQYGQMGTATMNSVFNALSNAVTGGNALFGNATTGYDQERDYGKAAMQSLLPYLGNIVGIFKGVGNTGGTVSTKPVDTGFFSGGWRGATQPNGFWDNPNDPAWMRNNPLIMR